jgi:hypothetical protein
MALPRGGDLGKLPPRYAFGAGDFIGTILRRTKAAMNRRTPNIEAMARIAVRNSVVAMMTLAVLGGCVDPGYIPTSAPLTPSGETAAPPAYNNPIFIPVADPQCAWEQVVETLGGYFRIEREEPVRLIGNTLTEGSVTTVPEVSPTIFEPWRHDTVDPDQRIENTLQSMRRRAVVRVIPAQGGHWVDVAVFKELEDNRHPDQATAGAATFRYDSTMTRVENPIGGEPTTLGWIARGRDTSLEQHIIGDLLSRCGPSPAR